MRYGTLRIGRLQRCILMKLQSSKISEMQECSNFDLGQLLQSLITLPQPYTQITLLALTPELLEFKVFKPVKSKHKKYKIMCTSDQIVSQARVLASGMAKFAVCKLVFNRNLVEPVQPQHLPIRIQLLEVFKSVTFNQILVEESAKDLSWIFDQIFTNFRFFKLTFIFCLSLRIIGRFICEVHERLLSINIIFCFQIAEFNQKELIQFSQYWINSLPPHSHQDKASDQLKFGYPFPKPERRSSRIGRKQQISLFHKQSQILTVRELQQQGRFFILASEYPLPLLTQLIHLLFLGQKGVTFEIPPVPTHKLIQIAEYAAYNLSKGYRINIGHQLELTHNRMILNTIDLEQKEVERLMKIGGKSGMHEIVIYSQHRYFEVALELYLQKPFIKFNFFMALEELTPEVQLLIKKIEAQCSITRMNAYSFAGILKHHGERGYVVVNSIFCALAEHSD